MKVAILTMFNGLSKTYSLVSVVEEHLHMMLEAGYHIKLLVSQDCSDSERQGIYLDERIEWVRITNRLRGEQIHWRDYSQSFGRVHETFFDETSVIADSMEEALRDVEVCMMHDILYQGWHLVHNIAIRQVQERLPHLRFLAMTHSLPAVRPFRANWPLSARFQAMPNTEYIYPTASGLPALARQYGIDPARCHVISNSWNPYAESSEALRQLGSRVDLMTPDILAIYPGRLTPGKQFDKAAALVGAMTVETGLDAKIVFCDFPSMDISSEAYKQQIRQAGERFGLEGKGVVFTSDEGWPDGLPHQAVMELFGLSNLFICSSYSESFGLIVLEAASRGNFIVLNEAVPALEELGRQMNAYFMRWNARNFGYETKEQYNPSEEAYIREHAAAIAKRMEGETMLRAKTIARQQYNPKRIWEKQLKPLLEGINRNE
ncbi:glycosyltransferase [Paenibacillus sp. PR3]|uniref:Glycosyltransferase n=1 Tax=Paenibacillus terricola TaxID=2763503 RepID=A0ABR8MTM9_9BACL|nr:glycosyltransferase [Paenibacillus terricola]MBD3919316.1 glycosyltransferase [Paenibacillus terricola]